MDATTIIDALGGYTQVAKDLNMGRTGVFYWLKAGIPKTRCLDVARLAEIKGKAVPFRDERGKLHPGITLEVLMLSTPRPPMRGKSPPPKRARRPPA